MASSIRRFATELKRRKVYQVAVVYVVVGFAVWEAADIAFPLLDLPAFAVTLVVVATVLGFPLVLVLAWAYEVRPQEEIDAAAARAEAGATPGEAASDPGTGPGSLTSTAPLPGFPPPGSSPASAKAGPAENWPSSPGAAAGTLEEPARPHDRSIVVLPFSDMSAEGDSEYFADGIVEELINALAQVRGLRVVARTSAFGFRGSTADIREIGRALDVSYVVEGSVRRSADRLRITAQLINASNGYHLWSERYERPVGDVFEIQDGIVEAVTENLLSRLPAGPEERTVYRDADPAAYDTYLRARVAFFELSPDGFSRATALFEEAIERDPHFALPHVGLAALLIFQATGFGTQPPRVIMPQARAAAESALSLSPDLPEGHLARGLIHLFHTWDFDAARTAIERALELSPSYFDAYTWLEMYHTYVRADYAEARRTQRRAAELSPLDPRPRARLGFIDFMAGEYAEAESKFRQLHEDGATPFLSTLGLLRTYMGSGRVNEAVAWGRRILAVLPAPNIALGSAGAAFAFAGQVEEAERMLRELEARGEQGAAVHYWVAIVLSALGRFDDAFDHLDRALEDGDPSLLYISGAPSVQGLQDDPRFAEVLDRLGLGHFTERLRAAAR